MIDPCSRLLRRPSTPMESRGFLARLVRDQRGNTLALMTAAMFPLIGMVGGGVDLGRMYIVKTKLQHACDAGALAGRRAMGAGTWAGNNHAARDTAEEFFKGNISTVPYGANTVDARFEESGGRVAGTASARVPMALMQIFDFAEQTVTVQCDAELQLPNTDVMFVLDASGSMADPIPGDTVTKMVALRKSVKCFYEAVARLDTGETCSTTPSGGVDPSIQIRFGFVPYSTNVNVGGLLPSTYFATKPKYQTREFANNAGGQAHWNYGFLEKNVYTLTSGNGAFPRTMVDKIGNGGVDKTVSWDGCIEEADTITGTGFSPIPADAYDLNIDLVPTQSDPRTLLKPVVGAFSYARKDGSGNWTVAPVLDTINNFTQGNYACPPASRKLQRWDTPATFEAYVNTLIPTSNTYHDIGLLWGARLTSPEGMFASENAATPSGQPIARHVIFMTDGDTNARNNDYAAYGLPWFDRRNVAAPGAWGDDFNDETNARLTAICEQVKDKNITLWVISFGSGVSSTAKTRLERCASPGHFYHASNAPALEAVFSAIAGKISELRITQ